MLKAIPEHIEKILKNLPSTPGVYQMKDADGKVIYVGKSVNLKSRVSSYFRDTGSLTLAKKQMVGKIEDIETILCQTEVEALVLETNLIKHLAPKYNILMKDDKNLAYIKITKSIVPEVYKTRQKTKDGALYFGPYTQGASIYESVKNLKRIFKIRNCKIRFDLARQGAWGEKEVVISDKAGKSIPCMDYYIGLCPAPCLLRSANLSEHAEHIESLKDFLRGNDVKIIETLEMKMHEHAKNLEFEEAAKLKSQIEAIRTLSEKQLARDVLPGDHDFFVALEKYGKLHVALMQIRAGQMIGVFRHILESRVDDPTDMVAQFLARQYISDETELELPDSLILAVEMTDSGLLDFFREKWVLLEYPTIGSKKELLDFAMNQAREFAYKTELQTLENKTLTREHMANVLDRLGYPVPKKGEIVFECYDISHTHGQFTYASRVVIMNGKPDPSRYKKYKIKTIEVGKIDDYASHREVMLRRAIEWAELSNFPHLIIIDGGKWQLSSAISGVREGLWTFAHERAQWNTLENGLNEKNKLSENTIPLPPICSIAKREEEIFLPEKKDPILFEKGTGELMVLQKARDESHRFSITANRQARTKAMKKNILEELPGIGPVTRKKLLKSAGTIDAIRTISLDELEHICTKTQIETLRDHGLL